MFSLQLRDRFFTGLAVLLFAFPLLATAGPVVTTTTLTYTPANWPQPLQGDLFLPGDGQVHPVVLLLHGGAWQHGDKSSMSGTGQALAARGYAVFAINYRLAPGATYPAQLQDMQQAVRWLQAHAGAYRLDMNRLAAWGYSAGGHLAALLAVQPPSDLPPVRVTIAGGAPSDLAAPEARDRASVQAFMGGSYSQIPALYERASPRRQVRPGLSPFFLYHGTADTLVSPLQTENFAATLQAAGVPVVVKWLPGLDHDQAAAAVADIRPAALAFLDRHINAGAGHAASRPATAAVALLSAGTHHIGRRP
jgi:acetyl esterase/lipase